jgi:hypothetical protein
MPSSDVIGPQGIDPLSRTTLAATPLRVVSRGARRTPPARATPGPMQSDTSGALRTCHSPAGCSNASHGLGESLAAECWGQRTSPPEAADLPHTAGSGPHRTTAPTTLRPMQIRRSGACVVLDRWGLGGGSALSGATHLWGPARWSLAVLVRIKPRARLWGAVRLRLGGATVWRPRLGGDRRMFDGGSGKHRG